MRLQVTSAAFKHADFVTGCGFVGSDLYTCSDDKTVRKINADGEDGGQVGETLKSYPTDMHWFPSASKKQQSDTFACGCSDGTFLLVFRNGRAEKPIQAHQGAVICIRWNNEGTAIATGGEDGVIKIWSRSGLLRSTLAQTDSMVYSLWWSPDSNSVCFTSGKDVIIKPVAPQAKQLNWKAHEGVVLAVDWNSVNNLIVTGGEDRKYKVWDSFGRAIFQSKPLEFSVTAVAWSISGELFAVGLYNSLRLCDRTGWSYSREHVATGSINRIAWTSDGTQLAGAGANGTITLGQVLGRRVEWQNFEVVLVDTHKVVVRDILSEMDEEELELKDRVIGLSVGYSSLVITTALQCCIYSLQNLNTPHIFDLKDTVNFIQLGEKYILMVDNSGMQIYTYDGRPVSAPKFQGMRPEVFNSMTVSMSTESIAVIDHSDAKMVRIFDTATGKEQPKPIQHVLEVTSVSMNRWGSSAHRKCVIQDRNRDLYVVAVGQAATAGKEQPPYKLGTMCDSAVWNSETDMLVAMMDSKLVVWYYPNVVFVDRDLTSQTKVVRDASEMGKDPQIVSFDGTHVTIRRSDGALLSSAVSPYPIALYGMVIKSMWEQAIQLCRYVKDANLWACLAVMALNDKELSTAEVAFAAIDEVAKLQYVLTIKEIPTTEGRNAELALWRRRPDEAEAILLQAKLTYRAIDMHMRLFHWDRALELAIHHKTHVDTVLALRQRYLTGMGREETNERFLQYSKGVTIDWAAIEKKVEQEKEAEAARPGARPYQE
mmetsp:Transcript_40835/g.96743  ORF Transcript_40835/g.96743 Transcript_40835/m.96743 type:complete len:767 (+) Transcript_40835:180-2480(+)|eukprot:CAMPEP_0180127224 /NCGR_PEP_ID=MMETSP0986-20121125/6118_1 /TAXON_ID=697907 /ORGANISM="non described non described, Strain CCMP2293" /LENGTH=766 /DNA_ID=CAMNT_0022066711 /DNA_START=133 /DNA_END=2433 /DNA_ORIENTATION=-